MISVGRPIYNEPDIGNVLFYMLIFITENRELDTEDYLVIILEIFSPVLHKNLWVLIRNALQRHFQ